MAASVPIFSFAQMRADADAARSIRRVLERESYVLGPEVDAFESAFAEYCGVGHCVGVANGTDALELALRALDIRTGDHVVVVANAGGYSAAAVRAVGATPVWVDVDARSLTMAPERLESALVLQPRAVIVTHLYGQLADIVRLQAMTEAAGVPLVEDCAQSHGARIGERVAGSFGDIGCYSFYPTKNLGAVGDGGAIVTSDYALSTRLRSLRQYGWSRKYVAEIGGGRNSRLDEVQAAVLLDKLPCLDQWNRQRRDIARRYSEGLQGLPLTLPPSLGDDYVAHLYVIRTRQRARLARRLGDMAIATAVHYPVADQRQPAFSMDDPPDLPATEEATETVLTLPCYPGLPPAEQDLVINTIRAFFAEGRP
jgi:dTDP-4-amino-4,6-dideoxygalactose transaminase